MPGNKREQNATRRDMEFATNESKLLIVWSGRSALSEQRSVEPRIGSPRAARKYNKQPGH